MGYTLRCSHVIKMDEKTSIDIERINENLVMTIWSPKKVLITVCMHRPEKGAGSVARAEIEHRTVEFDRQLSGIERNEIVKRTVAEVLL